MSGFQRRLDVLKYLTTVLLLLLCPNISYSQRQEAVFDSIYIHTATVSAGKNLTKAIFTADSLVAHAANSNQKMRGILLLAMLHEGRGEFVSALSYALQSEKIAIADKNYEWQVRSSGYLASIYRRVDLISEAEKHIDIANEANQFRKKEDNYFSIQSIIHHERAFHEMDKNNNTAALAELQKSEDNFKKNKDSPMNPWVLASIYESYAQTYLSLKDYNNAEKKIIAALELLDNQEHEIKGTL